MRASCGANVRLQQSDKLNCIYILAVMCWFIAGDLLQQQTCEKTCDFQTFIPPPHQENTAGANTVAVKRCTFIWLRMLKLGIIIDWNSECIVAWREQTKDFLTHFCKVWFCTDFLSDRMPRKTQAGIDDISILKLNKTACWSFKNVRIHQHINWTNPHFHMWRLDQLTVMNIPNSYNLSLSLYLPLPQDAGLCITSSYSLSWLNLRCLTRFVVLPQYLTVLPHASHTALLLFWEL